MIDKILVVGESQDGKLRNVTFETTAAAKRIRADAEVVALLLGDSDLNTQAEEMIQYGADRAIIVTHDNLKNYTSEGYGQVLMEVMEEEDPYGVVMGHTSIGKDVTPKVAVRLELGLILDAIEIEQDGVQVGFTRAI